MFGTETLGAPTWWILAVVVAVVTGGLLLAGRGADTGRVDRFRRPIALLFGVAVLVVTAEYLLWGLYLSIVTEIAGVAAAYLVFGSLVVIAAVALLDGYRTDDGDRVTRRRWPVFVALLIVGGALLLAYAYLATSGWLVMFTLFADDHRAENFEQMDGLFPSETIEAGDDHWELAHDEQPLPESFVYGDDSHDTDEFLTAQESTGLLVLHQGEIVHESYYRGYDETSQATSWSAGKSVTSALVGIAIEEGHIDSVDDPIVTYVPELEGSGYDNATIEDALTMSSGVAFDERYDEFLTDPVELKVNAYAFNESMRAQIAELDSDRQSGEYKEYVSVDTAALGLVIEEATGESLASYAETRLWQPAGMEGDAFWTVDHAGSGLAYCCLNAQLRDYARFGELYRTGGVVDGERVVSEDWIERSTTPQPPHEEPPDAVFGFGDYEYGYQWWVPEDGIYEAHGIYGQYVYVDTENEVVIAQTATNAAFVEDDTKRFALFQTISDDVAGH